ncbi:hypothetical protein ACFFGR_06310 [Arthrobacter liuii]|uniref:Uncharacterized protein n=1 Tax=Arthrobacter liuii TaxID=1476996 RepID=A0ABQ2AU82_9MICC|nr:hypothetical protein [Arthrobacter liuii]GGH96461.1 hypothetical protein GCM10007170_24360 [Arthrobacter liuii]
MFTKRTTLIGAALALGFAAVAAPAQAASGNGAEVTKYNECQSGQDYSYCRTGTAVSHHVSTPSGMESTSSSSNHVDTSTYSDGSQNVIATQTHFHILVRDGQLAELGQHYREQTTQTGPDGTRQCWEREDSHQVGNSVQYHREARYCP